MKNLYILKHLSDSDLASLIRDAIKMDRCPESTFAITKRNLRGDTVEFHVRADSLEEALELGRDNCENESRELWEVTCVKEVEE